MSAEPSFRDLISQGQEDGWSWFSVPSRSHPDDYYNTAVHLESGSTHCDCLNAQAGKEQCWHRRLATIAARYHQAHERLSAYDEHDLLHLAARMFRFLEREGYLAATTPERAAYFAAFPDVVEERDHQEEALAS